MADQHEPKPIPGPRGPATDPPSGVIATADAGRLRRWRLAGTWLVALVLLGGVVVVVLRMGELEGIIALASRANPWWLLAALGLQAATYAAVALVWWLALSRAGGHRSLSALLRLAVIKLFADQALPSSGLSGTLIVTRALAARGVLWPVALGTMLFGMVTGYAAYLLAVFAALGALWILDDARPVFVAVAAALCGVAVVTPLTLLLGKHWAAHPRIMTIARWLGAREALGLLADAHTDLLRRPALMAGGIGAQMGVFVLDALTLAVAFRALGRPVSLGVTFPALVMATVAVTLMPLPVSVGTFEGACVAVLVSLGVPAGESLAATLVLRGMTFWLPMVPGSLMLRAELRQSPAPGLAAATGH